MRLKTYVLINMVAASLCLLVWGLLGGGSPGEVISPTPTPAVNPECPWMAAFYDVGYPEFNSVDYSPIVREKVCRVSFNWVTNAPHAMLQGAGQYWAVVFRADLDLPQEVRFHFVGRGSVFALTDGEYMFVGKAEDEAWWKQGPFDMWVPWRFERAGFHEVQIEFAPQERVPAELYFEW